MWSAALRRLAGLFVLASALTVVGALLFGAATGADTLRALSLGFYLTGSFLLVAGFFVGNRGPVRLKGGKGGEGTEGGGFLFFGSRFARWASPAEREENINLSAIFVVLGFVLILVGVAADTRYNLV
ncbi:MAG TPA: hypothetical protein VHK46_03325 [Gaiellaceae bacterium]|nr:hypothetical protein [Gaiellaceae bacterium]